MSVVFIWSSNTNEKYVLQEIGAEIIDRFLRLLSNASRERESEAEEAQKI
jgi:hypothetical protein